MRNRLMTHVIAGYPTMNSCVELLLGMQSAGVYAVEVQIPFSDPSADGPLIMKANDIAIQNNMTIQQCFKMINIARKAGLNVPIYLMSYINKIYYYGFEEFCVMASKCNVAGLIVPDLPYDTKEYRELHLQTNKFGIEIVPVFSPGTLSERLSMYHIKNNKMVYITSMKGITGKELVIREELIRLIQVIRSQSNCKIALGFGVRTSLHVESALKLADIAVVGSEVIRHIEGNNVAGGVRFVSQLVNNSKHSSISANSTILGDNDE